METSGNDLKLSTDISGSKLQSIDTIQSTLGSMFWIWTLQYESEKLSNVQAVYAISYFGKHFGLLYEMHFDSSVPESLVCRYNIWKK